VNSLCIIKTHDWRGGVASQGGASRSDERSATARRWRMSTSFSQRTSRERSHTSDSPLTDLSYSLHLGSVGSFAKPPYTIPHALMPPQLNDSQGLTTPGQWLRNLRTPITHPHPYPPSPAPPYPLPFSPSADASTRGTRAR
jgi:hypothetical protein